MSDENCIFNCPQCSKIFATRSNLKRHMENPNIHNIPYERIRDQKRWKDHSKKISSRQETTERMRKWRAENKDKNKRNDLRCRVYRLARQKFGEHDSEEKRQFIESEINRRIKRKILLDQKNNDSIKKQEINELPFYCAPLHKIELPLVDTIHRRASSTTEPSVYVSSKSQPPSPVSDLDRRNSDDSIKSQILPPVQNLLTIYSPPIN